MSQQLVLLVIGLVVAVIILRPLLKGRSTTVAPARSVRDPGPAVASADELAELELDHSMGRVSDADYARWRGAIGTSVAVAPDESSDTPVADASARAEALVRQFRERPRSRCSNCGERPEVDARFCSNCGNELKT
jgi:cytochrome c-type biogenesis protein CcmH/NrfG